MPDPDYERDGEVVDYGMDIDDDGSQSRSRSTTASLAVSTSPATT